MFLKYERVFPNGATESDLLKIYRPRPGLPFTKVRLARNRTPAMDHVHLGTG